MSENSFSYADDGDINDGDDAAGINDPTLCGGVLKPNMIFFGETLPNSVAKRLEKDREKADAIIVMGTSLSVAPMSKVIQYLSPSIPRFLINRDVVKAVNRQVGDNHVKVKNGKNEEGEEEEDARDGYVFDACLLGFCDEVSRALVKEMNCNTNKKPVKESEGATIRNGGDETYRMLCTVEEEYRAAGGTIRGLHRHPSNRVLLFPGAMIPTEGSGNAGADSDSDASYREVAQCDGCQKEIKGGIMKCQQCFDFDLCKKCYNSKLPEMHFEGRHTFVEE